MNMIGGLGHGCVLWFCMAFSVLMVMMRMMLLMLLMLLLLMMVLLMKMIMMLIKCYVTTGGTRVVVDILLMSLLRNATIRYI